MALLGQFAAQQRCAEHLLCAKPYAKEEEEPENTVLPVVCRSPPRPSWVACLAELSCHTRVPSWLDRCDLSGRRPEV